MQIRILIDFWGLCANCSPAANEQLVAGLQYSMDLHKDPPNPSRSLFAQPNIHSLLTVNQKIHRQNSGGNRERGQRQQQIMKGSAYFPRRRLSARKISSQGGTKTGNLKHQRRQCGMLRMMDLSTPLLIII